MERRNFQGANRKHNSDLSVCHTAHTHTHTHLDTQSRRKKKPLGRKNKSHCQVGKVGQWFVRGRTGEFTICFSLLSCTTVHNKQSLHDKNRERENTEREREGERWKRGGRSAERTSRFKLRHVDMCALCAQFSVCVSICSRQRGLTKSALLVWHTGWVSVPEKSLKSCFFFNAGALNKVLCCENRSNAPNWTFQRV